MKKLFVILMGLGFSMNALADGKALTTGAAATTVATGDCQALDEGVTINTSANVLGYVDCPDTYSIAVATCHTAGRKDNGTNVNIYLGSSSGGSISADQDQTACTPNTAQTVAGAAS
jgi:hypothetical protein